MYRCEIVERLESKERNLKINPILHRNRRRTGVIRKEGILVMPRAEEVYEEVCMVRLDGEDRIIIINTRCNQSMYKNSTTVSYKEWAQLTNPA